MANVSRLPEYPLVVSLVSHERPGDYPTRIELRQVAIELKGWTRLDVAENAEKLEAYNRKHAILVAPQREAAQWIGFRNVEAQQLERMRRDGFEPAWLVKVGERFDVLLRAPSPLTPEESRQLKNHLTAVYQLTLPREALRDAIRLPGFVAELGKPGSRAELVEAKDRAFSAGERVLTQLRNREEQVHLARWARAQPLSPSLADQPIAGLRVDSLPSPRLPTSHLVAQVQTRLLETELSSGFAGFRLEAGRSGLLRQAGMANREFLTALRQSNDLAVVRLPVFRDLVLLEKAFEHNRAHHLADLSQEESYVRECRQELARAVRELPRQAGVEGAGHYLDSVSDAFAAERAWSQIKTAYLEDRREHGELGMGRLAVAVELSPRDERVHVAFRIAAEREATLRLDHGESFRPTSTDTAGLHNLKALLAAHLAKEGEIVTQLKNGSHASREQLASLVSGWRESILHRVELQRSLRFAELGARVEAATLQRDAALFTERDAAMSSLTLHLRALGDWNAAAPATDARPGTQRAETEALVAVAGGDVSPRALARLQGELIASIGERAIPHPVKPLTETDPLDLLRRFASLESEVRSWASDMSAQPDWFDGGAEHLIAKSAALIQVQQAVEKLERCQHGVAEPSPAPDGTAQATWDRAWLKRAEEKGLPQPERHLGNVGPALAPRELAMERAVALKTVEVQAVRAVSRELERGAVLR